MYEVIMSEPVLEYLKNLEQKASTIKNHRIEYKQILQYIAYLKTSGTYIGEPVVKHIDGDIWELRPNKNRVLFVHYKENQFVILHIFRKETQKTPSREIEIAKSNLRKFLNRKGI